MFTCSPSSALRPFSPHLPPPSPPPVSGLFTYSEETRCHWFRLGGGPPGRDAQYTLTGLLLGLAIYNSVILDVRLPMVVYRKLSGRRGVLEDLQEFSPVRDASSSDQ